MKRWQVSIHLKMMMNIKMHYILFVIFWDKTNIGYLLFVEVRLKR